MTVQSPTPGKAPDLQVFENGAQVPPANVQMVDPGAPAAIALVIDTSNSMAGTKLNDAIAAAHGFVSAQKNGNLLGVYGFDSSAYPAARLSPDRTEIDTAISQLGTGGAPGTALYGAVKLASEDLQTAPAQRRVMILITDGSSQSDTATLDEAIAAAKQAGVLIYTVGIATSGPAQTALNQIASDTGGTATSVTDSSALAGIYSTIESELGNSYTYMYQSMVAPGAPLVLKLSSPGLGDAREVLKAPGTYVPPTKAGGGLKLPTGAPGRILMAALVGFFVLLAMILVMAARPDVILQKRIAPYTDSKKSVVVESDGEATPTSRISLLHQLFISTERIIGSMNFWKRMSANLEQADLPLRTAELFYIQIGTALLFGFITAFILGHRGLIGLAALILGGMVPAIYVRLKAKKRLTLFESQLPETLITMAASLKAGHAFNQSVAERRPRGRRSDREGVLASGRRDPAGSALRAGAGGDGRAHELVQLRLRRDGREHPAHRRRQPRRHPGHGLGHGAPAPAVRAQGEGADRAGPDVGLRADRDAVPDGPRHLRPEPDLHVGAVHDHDGQGHDRRLARDDGDRFHDHQENRVLQGVAAC